MGVSSACVVFGDRGLDGRGGPFPGGVEHHVVPGGERLGGGVVGAGGGGELFGRSDQPVVLCAEDGDRGGDALGVQGSHHVLEGLHRLGLEPAVAVVDDGGGGAGAEEVVPGPFR